MGYTSNAYACIQLIITTATYGYLNIPICDNLFKPTYFHPSCINDNLLITIQMNPSSINIT